MSTSPSLTQTPFNEFWHAGGFIVSEARGHRSRDAATIGGATIVYPGTVLGFRTGGVATAWPGNAEQVNSNVGNGTIAMAAPPIVAGAQLGIYSVVATDATHFAVTDPFGNSLGTATVGTAFSNEVAFTITAGATAFETNDGFSIEVEAINGVYVPLNPSASDGSQNVAAIAFAPVDTTATDKRETIVTRACEVNASELIWPVGITDAQMASAAEQLAALGIIAR